MKEAFKKYSVFICALFMVAGVAANTIPRWVCDETQGDIFCFWVAVSFCLILIGGRFNTGTFFENALIEMTFALAANDATDEYFHIARKVNPYEIHFGIGAVCWLLLRVIIHNYKREKQCRPKKKQY